MGFWDSIFGRGQKSSSSELGPTEPEGKQDPQLLARIKELEASFSQHPGNAETLWQLGQAWQEAGNLAKAVKMFRGLLLQQLDPSGPVTKGDVFHRLADIHERLERRSVASPQKHAGFCRLPYVIIRDHTRILLAGAGWV